MSTHVLHSDKHGELIVEIDEHSDACGRPLRARLVQIPPRLRHLLAVHGHELDELLEHVVAAVDRHDAHGLVPRGRARP